jgi:hypothetical protein
VVNRYVAGGICPFCYGQGCFDCDETGTLAGMWQHQADMMAIHAEYVRRQLEAQQR